MAAVVYISGWWQQIMGPVGGWVRPKYGYIHIFFIEPFPKEPINLRMNHYYMVIDVPPI